MIELSAEIWTRDVLLRYRLNIYNKRPTLTNRLGMALIDNRQITKMFNDKRYLPFVVVRFLGLFPGNEWHLLRYQTPPLPRRVQKLADPSRPDLVWYPYPLGTDQITEQPPPTRTHLLTFTWFDVFVIFPGERRPMFCFWCRSRASLCATSGRFIRNQSIERVLSLEELVRKIWRLNAIEVVWLLFWDQRKTGFLSLSN